MALSAILHLKSKIQYVLISSDTPLYPPFQEILEFAYEQVEYSEEIAKRLFPSSQIRLVREIVDAVYKLEHDLISSEQIHDLEKEINFFAETMKKLEGEYGDELYNFNSLPEGEEEDDDDDEETVSPISGSNMVGLMSDEYNHLKESLTIHRATQLRVVSLCGMPGIGKTTLATRIFEDPHIVQHFECRVWVTVGRKCRYKEIPQRILAEVAGGDDQMRVEQCDEDVVECLNECLQGKRYLIVLDDVWDKYMAENFQTPVFSRRRNEFKNHFQDEKNGSRLLLTSRLQQVDEFDSATFASETITMRLMDEEESWQLLRKKVFGDQESSCPSQLERFGRKIAEKCEGLPLTIVTVANLLSKEVKTVEYWNEVATRKNDQLFKAAYDRISKVLLLPSYKHLPRPLQMCFMYIGVFPPYYEIPLSKLTNLWSCDGFLKRDQSKCGLVGTTYCLEELARNSMILLRKNYIKTILKIRQNIKTCRLHSSLWYLAIREATRSKFSHVLNSLDDGLGDGIKSQHRLSFHNNILLGIKEVNESVSGNCASTARSLLCYGPYLQYQVPLCFGLRLLRELDALTIRFYEFPIEVLQLVRLKYLALTLNGKLPAAISDLSHLRFLIVDRHLRLSIKSYKDVPYLPMEIWKMKKLQHLQVTGNDLPDPCGASLERLLKLSGVSPNSCTHDVLRAIPNLEKLGIQVELTPPDSVDGQTFMSCHSLASHHLLKITSFKCVVVNPRFGVGPTSMPVLSNFPPFLVKLTLSGLGCAWEEMRKIASLKHLSVLKLRSYAFRGPEWKVGRDEFISLEYLAIEDTDLVKWKIGHESLSLLDCLIIKRCYKLKVIHGKFGKSLKQIEMVDCNPLGVEQMKKAKSSKSAQVRVSCSWYKEKPKAWLTP